MSGLHTAATLKNVPSLQVQVQAGVGGEVDKSVWSTHSRHSRIEMDESPCPGPGRRSRDESVRLSGLHTANVLLVGVFVVFDCVVVVFVVVVVLVVVVFDAIVFLSVLL